ncbi:MAG: pyridoxal phosphate-dependent decarboxylase family protein, partial [Angustibacter sp.]
MPELPRPASEVLAEVLHEVLPRIVPQDHPRYLATIPSPGNFVGAAAEFLAAGFNVFAGNWAEGEGPARIERSVIDWLAKICGFPEGAGGLCVSGGSHANLTGLVAARFAVLGDDPTGAVFYLTEQAHSCFTRIARVLGIPRQHLVRIPVDDRGRMSLSALATAHATTRAAGLRPFAVVATAGGTNTGVVDPLAELARWARRAGIWLHVDGAYGGAGIVDPANAILLRGLAEVDSLALDPHKWWFQPFGIGALIVREPATLASAFRVVPEYLEQLHSAVDQDIDYYDYGFEVTRPFRALKVWMSVQTFGVAAVRAAVIAGRECAERVSAGIGSLPGWEVVTGPQLAISTF